MKEKNEESERAENPELQTEKNIGKFLKPKENTKMSKFWVIFMTLLVLLIPLSFLSGIIKDRESYRNEAVHKIASSWGGEQVINTPSMYFTQNAGDQVEYKYLPLINYKIGVNIKTETRKKGMFKVPVYTADVIMKGNFINLYGSLNGKKITTEFSVKDTTGFISEPEFIINNGKPAAAHNTKYTAALTTNANYIPFEISYKIRGINKIDIRTGGQISRIKIFGNWKDPEFEGNFLPSYKKVEKDSFFGEWSVPQIAASGLQNPYIGVSLLVPVDNYRMADRTLKYAFLFLSLTFLSYFIYEITSKKSQKIHPLQYMLLGGSMLIFYLLLVSISEFMPFLAAYIISALMIISLIGIYTHNVITKRSNLIFSAVICCLLALLYIFLYVLLSLQDFSLLIGSFGLFIIIAAIMYVTRNVEWYSSENV